MPISVIITYWKPEFANADEQSSVQIEGTLDESTISFTLPRAVVRALDETENGEISVSIPNARFLINEDKDDTPYFG